MTELLKSEMELQTPPSDSHQPYSPLPLLPSTRPSLPWRDWSAAQGEVDGAVDLKIKIVGLPEQPDDSCEGLTVPARTGSQQEGGMATLPVDTKQKEQQRKVEGVRVAIEESLDALVDRVEYTMRAQHTRARSRHYCFRARWCVFFVFRSLAPLLTALPTCF